MRHPPPPLPPPGLEPDTPVLCYLGVQEEFVGEDLEMADRGRGRGQTGARRGEGWTSSPNPQPQLFQPQQRPRGMSTIKHSNSSHNLPLHMDMVLVCLHLALEDHTHRI